MAGRPARRDEVGQAARPQLQTAVIKRIEVRGVGIPGQTESAKGPRRDGPVRRKDLIMRTLSSRAPQDGRAFWVSADAYDPAGIRVPAFLAHVGGINSQVQLMTH